MRNRRFQTREKRPALRNFRDGGGRHRQRESVWNNVPGETRRGIAVIFLFAAAAFSLLALLGLAGDAGEIWNEATAALFGRTRAATPLFFLLLSGIIAIPEKITTRAQGKIGLAILFLSVNGTIHLIEKKANPLEGVLGDGGGYLGILTAYPTVKIMGYWAALLVIITLLCAGLFLTFSLSLKNFSVLMALPRSIFKMLRSFAFIFKKYPRMETDELQRHQDFSFRSLGERTERAPQAKTNVLAGPGRPTASPAPQKTKRLPVSVPLEFLHERKNKPSAGDIDAAMERIRKTLENFGISVEMGDVSVGPTVTQYTLKPAEGIKLARITGLSNDLALALAAHPIRIEAPIPGKSLVGIEVPNHTIATVGLRELLEAPAFRERKNSLMVALGKDVAGHPWLADLGRMPHLLVAGATGSGKTVSLNAIIMSLLYENGPDTLKLILVDPKRVELTNYNDIPHLITPVITEVPKTVNALKWAISEMDHRFDLLQRAGARDILSYNHAAEEPMPYLVIVIDELADLMVAAASEVEGSIIRLAQMSRAVGIHLILATQRPSVDIITGLIKANITSRIAFAVASQTDSRTILDTSGADKLLGRGDMLYLSAELSKPKRLQGAYVADDEISKVVEFWKTQGAPEYNQDITEKQQRSFTAFEENLSDGDPLLPEAQSLVIMAGKASASLLQRRLKVGYARAARLLDIMEEHCIIGPGDGAKPREILVARPAEMEMVDEPENNEQDEENPL
ncbi:DNA translocase FtsK [Candidatus Uhrbacteria bacterium]|nr:DNA translocase FtsK [Candidatus Uhrbacteria bacterium]